MLGLFVFSLRAVPTLILSGGRVGGRRGGGGGL